MIEIIYETYREGHVQIVKMSMKGHADYDDSGKDIVCSSVSVLFFNLMDILDRMDNFDGAAVSLPGDVELEYQYPADNIQCQTVIDFTLNGLDLVAENYPDNVQIKNIIESGAR